MSDLFTPVTSHSPGDASSATGPQPRAHWP